MKYLYVLLLLICSSSLIGQNLMYDKYLDTTLKADVTYDTALVQKMVRQLENIKILSVYCAEWGDSLNSEKYLSFTDSIGKVLIFQKGAKDSLEVLNINYVFEGVGDYPETSEISKMFTIDFDDDGLLELMVIEYGGEKRWSEEHHSTYTAEYCTYSVFKQFGKEIRVLEYGIFETDKDLCQFKKWNDVIVIDRWKGE